MTRKSNIHCIFLMIKLLFTELKVSTDQFILVDEFCFEKLLFFNEKLQQPHKST